MRVEDKTAISVVCDIAEYDNLISNWIVVHVGRMDAPIPLISGGCVKPACIRTRVRAIGVTTDTINTRALL